MKYRKKPIVIEAIKYNGKNAQEIANFMGCQYPATKDEKLVIRTLEGNPYADIGDWIIKDVKGEFYPIKNDIFLATYEKVIDKYI